MWRFNPPHFSVQLSCTLRDATSGAGTNLKVGEFFRAFLALRVQLVVLVSAFVIASIQFGQFLVRCSSTHGAPCPAICKSGGSCPRAL